LTRFRLRFLLQEFDLAGPDVLLGRSPECQVTLEDPLVSRRHARVVIEDDTAVIHDLGSRNGVRVNGRRIQEPTRLKDGDRLRLGTQELVFFAMRRNERLARTTGFMRTCRACGTPFPEQAWSCPHCGHQSTDDETVTGVKVEVPRRWTFQLLTEVGDRAIEIGNYDQAERILRRAAKEIAEREGAGESIDATQVHLLGAFALRVAQVGSKPSWVSWTLDLHRTHGFFPAHDVVEALVELSWEGMEIERRALLAFTQWADASSVADVAAAADVEKLRGLTERLIATGTEGRG
jgi:hypothetical protein